MLVLLKNGNLPDLISVCQAADLSFGLGLEILLRVRAESALAPRW
jgi:hypothetical protein